jgi:predicted RNA-binding Zn-ribbon protein involved in translation (DUF1610 family)
MRLKDVPASGQRVDVSNVRVLIEQTAGDEPCPECGVTGA